MVQKKIESNYTFNEDWSVNYVYKDEHTETLKNINAKNAKIISPNYLFVQNEDNSEVFWESNKIKLEKNITKSDLTPYGNNFLFINEDLFFKGAKVNQLLDLETFSLFYEENEYPPLYIISDKNGIYIWDSHEIQKFDGIDGATLKVFRKWNYHFIIDKDNLYKNSGTYTSERNNLSEVGIDYATFEPVSEDLIKDKNKFYREFVGRFKERKTRGINTESDEIDLPVDKENFEILTGYIEFLAKDSKYVYVDEDILMGLNNPEKTENGIKWNSYFADPLNLEVVSDHVLKDKNMVFVEKLAFPLNPDKLEIYGSFLTDGEKLFLNNGSISVEIENIWLDIKNLSYEYDYSIYEIIITNWEDKYKLIQRAQTIDEMMKNRHPYDIATLEKI